jgi:hypothetical protein
MKSRITKSVPNPTNPGEVFKHYREHLKRWFHMFYRDTLLDLSGNKRNKKYAELFKLQGKRKGKIAFVLASGPSINKLDPEKVKKFCIEHNAEIFCINYFVNSAFAEITQADYWLISDPRHFDVTIQDTAKAYSNLARVIRKGVFAADSHSHLAKANTHLPIIPFNDYETSGIFSKNTNPCYPRSYVTMSAYKALAVATFMGYDKVYICGFDNTYIRDLGCDENNTLYRRINHFYTNPTVNADPLNYRDYNMGLGANEKPRLRTVAEELLAYSRLFSDLNRFKKFPVFNLDGDSLTDAFPKDLSLDIYK